MIPVFTINEIKAKLKKAGRRSGDENETAHMSLMLEGDLRSALTARAPTKNRNHVLGVLFSNPAIPFVKNEIVPALNQLHHAMSTHLDIFCAGYYAFPIPGQIPDGVSIGTVEDRPWGYSAKEQVKLEREFEEMSSWKSNGETTLLLLEVEFGGGNVQFRFDHCLVLNLESMMKDGAITSVRGLIYTLVRQFKSKANVWDASDKIGAGALCDLARNAVLSCLPPLLKDSYTKAEHFAVRNLEKK